MSSTHEQIHRAAAERHEAAARGHEKAARFWAQLDDAARAGLQREMSVYERQGAQLELRWAELEAGDQSVPPEPTLEPVRRRVHENTAHIHEHASHLASALSRTAELLEESAALAEEHATHPAVMAAGNGPKERQTAKRARAAARSARAQAAHWQAVCDDGQHRPTRVHVDNY